MAFLKQLAKKELFIPHIERYLNKADFPAVWNFPIVPSKEKDSYFHPSGDCTPCERYLFTKFSAPELLPLQTTNATSQKNFMVGHFWHRLMQDIFVATDMAEKREVEKVLNIEQVDSNHHEGWIAQGSADIARAYSPGRSEPFLIDFKTMNSRSFSNGPSDDLMWKWRLQVNCYMDFMNHNSEYEVIPTQAVMILIQKDSPHTFKEILVDYEPDIIDPIYNKWSIVYDALRTNVPPQCECPIGRCPVEGSYVTSKKANPRD